MTLSTGFVHFLPGPRSLSEVASDCVPFCYVVVRDIALEEKLDDDKIRFHCALVIKSNGAR